MVCIRGIAACPKTQEMPRWFWIHAVQCTCKPNTCQVASHWILGWEAHGISGIISDWNDACSLCKRLILDSLAHAGIQRLSTQASSWQGRWCVKFCKDSGRFWDSECEVKADCVWWMGKGLSIQTRQSQASSHGKFWECRLCATETLNYPGNSCKYKKTVGSYMTEHWSHLRTDTKPKYWYTSVHLVPPELHDSLRPIISSISFRITEGLPVLAFGCISPLSKTCSGVASASMFHWLQCIAKKSSQGLWKIQTHWLQLKLNCRPKVEKRRCSGRCRKVGWNAIHWRS